MPRKGFHFNRSLNTSLPAVENVFDDLTKPSQVKQQSIENTDSKSNISSIVRDIVNELESPINNDILSNIDSNTKTSTSIEIQTSIETNRQVDIVSSIENNISTSTNSSAASEITTQPNDKPSGEIRKTITSSKANQKEEITVRDLSKWHTEAEQKVYRILYNQTIGLERNNWYFSFNELMKKTGFKSKITIAVAIDGLAAKKSIDILTDKRGDHLGKRYKVYIPSEILFRREQDNIKIDPQTKRIVF